MVVPRATFVLAALVLGACPSPTDSEDMTGGDDGVPGPCVPGQSMACECDDGSSGARVCAAGGDGYGACDCAGGGGGAGDDAGADTSASGDDVDDDGGDGSLPSDDDGSGDDGSPGDDAEPGTPSWSADVVPFLEQYCGANNATCHRREAYTAIVDKGCLGWASFENVPLGSVQNAGETPDAPTGCPDLELYDRLVNRSPWQCGAFFGTPTETLVVPGDAGASYMIKKTNGTLLCDDSEPMPPPDSGIVVPAAAMKMFRDWIDAGAPID